MKRVLLMLTVVMSLLGCAAPPPVAMAKRVGVLIEYEAGSGSGVVINKECVVTAAHVVTADQQAKVTLGNGDVVMMTPVPIKTDADIAVLCTDHDMRVDPAYIAHQMPEPYEPVYAYGFPLHTPKYFSSGIYEGGDATSIPVAPGMSGGGVYDAAGHLIGLVDSHEVYTSEFGVFGYGYLSHIVTLHDIQDALKSAHIIGG